MAVDGANVKVAVWVVALAAEKLQELEQEEEVVEDEQYARKLNIINSHKSYIFSN